MENRANSLTESGPEQKVTAWQKTTHAIKTVFAVSKRKIRFVIWSVPWKSGPSLLSGTRPPPQHQLRDFDVVRVGDLEDLAVAEHVAASGGGRTRCDMATAWLGGVEAIEEDGRIPPWLGF